MQASEFTVGWICALPSELAAARYLLDEHYAKLELEQTDSNSYHYGRIGSHNVVIAVLPSGQMGTNMASAVGSSLKAFFPSLRFGLMVGIGGGVPSDENDIRLGDVVISSPSGIHGGVVQYDLGKQTKAMKRIGHLQAPPQILLTALNSYRSDAILADENSRFAEQLARFKPLRKKGFTRETCGLDELYRDDALDDDLAEPQDLANIVCREARDSLLPEIFFGTIASGNQVMKSSKVRDKYSKELGGVLCFEMEAAGLMNVFPCLVIRGICDYCDSHKNDKWQHYAAATAAACASDFLRNIPTSSVAKLDRLGKALEGQTQAIQGIAAAQEESGLRAWLNPPDASTNFNSATSARMDGTGLWLLSEPKYTTMKAKAGSLLWLHGLAGCGKTILSSAAIDDLKSSDTATTRTIYFYFDFKDTFKRTLDQMLRSLIRQCMHGQSIAMERVRALRRFCGDEQPSTDRLRHLFDDLMARTGTTRVVVDALDEAEPRGPVLDWIAHVVQIKDTCTRFLATSRDEQDIRTKISAISRCEELPILENSASQKDISFYIGRRLYESTDFSMWKSRPDLLEMIHERLLAKTGGMFRWVACQLDNLQLCITPRELRQTLTMLPQTLDETYGRMIKNIKPMHKHEAMLLLQVIMLSDSPVPLIHVIEILATDTESLKFNPKDRIIRPASLQNLCPGLTQITRLSAEVDDASVNNLAIGFAHYSVKEYLLASQALATLEAYFSPARLYATMVEVSVSYLSQIQRPMDMSNRLVTVSTDGTHLIGPGPWVFVSSPFEDQTHTYRTVSIIKERPWLGGAQKTLLRYAPLVSASDTHVQDIILDLFSDRERQASTDPAFNEMASIRFLCPGPRNSLLIAAHGGMAETCRRLIEAGYKVNGLPRHYPITLIQAASYSGSPETVKVLLSHGASIDHADGWPGSPLQISARQGYVDIVHLLLGAGADPNAQTYSELERPLVGAIRCGSRQIICALLDKGAQIETRGSALQQVFESGHQDVSIVEGLVQLLVRRGADLHATGGPHGTPLNTACYLRQDNVVRMLLDQGADPTLESRRYKNSLHAACSHEQPSVDIIQALLDQGVKPNAVDKHRRTVLHIICEGPNPNFEIVDLLLKRGAEVNMRPADEVTALQRLCQREDDQILDVARVLLQHGADVNASSGYIPAGEQSLATDTALHHAVQFKLNPKRALVKLLLEKGADVTVRGRHGESVLQRACRSDRAYIDGRADNVRYRFGERNPLVFDIIKMLLEKGAAVDTKAGPTAKYPHALAEARGNNVSPEIIRLLESASNAYHDTTALTAGAPGTGTYLEAGNVARGPDEEVWVDT